MIFPSTVFGYSREKVIREEDFPLNTLGLHWENYISISFHSEWDRIVVTVFEPNGIYI